MAKRTKPGDEGLGKPRPEAAGPAPDDQGLGNVRPEAPLNRAERRHPRDSTKAPRPAR